MSQTNKNNNRKLSQLHRKLDDLKALASEQNISIESELSCIEEKIEAESSVKTPWERVSIARHFDRPGTLKFIDMIFDDFMEMHGDRFFGDDPAMVGGIAKINGMAVTVLGNQKGSNLKENIYRNYGMAHPEGYRKVLRLAKQAEKFRRPIITFIDTPGAYPGVSAEERGIGEAIANNLKEFSQLRTPILCIVIGEGGSGGALGIGVGDKIFMLENSVYSVISPEGAASIMLRDASRAKEAAKMMKITSDDLLKFNLINGIIEEPAGGAHLDMESVSKKVKDVILSFLEQNKGRNTNQIVRSRNKKLRNVGRYRERTSTDKK